MQITEADKLVLLVYKFVMPFVGAALVFVLGMIARWMRSVGKDLRIIRESLVKHEAIRDEHGRSIEALRESDKEHEKEINLLRVKIAGSKNGL